MEILRGIIDWNELWANGPSIKLIVDKLPDYKDLRYTRHPATDKLSRERGHIYYAELGGYVSFYYYSRPDEGYGGRKFPLSMEDGSTRILVGPWSSNSMSVNRLGLGPCVEVTITDDEKVWDRGYTFYASAATIALIEKYIDRITFGTQYAKRMHTTKKITGAVTLFPQGSTLQILPVEWNGIHYVPMVLFPDGTLWTKLERDLNNIIERVTEDECCDIE